MLEIDSCILTPEPVLKLVGRKGGRSRGREGGGEVGRDGRRVGGPGGGRVKRCV